MQVLMSIMLFYYATRVAALMETLYEWKYMSYAWKSFDQMHQFISEGKYDSDKVIPLDIDRSMDGRIFVTVARDKGVPASVHTVHLNNGSRLRLSPYPNWEAYEDFNCDNIINVYKIAIDECDRLWMLDSGKLRGRFVCPPKLLVYRLYRNQHKYTIEIPETVYNQNSLLVALIVKTSGLECDKTEVFITDSDGHGIIIYSFHESQFSRFESKDYYPKPEHVNFNIAGEYFTLNKGVSIMAMSPMRYPSGATLLSYAALASRTVHSLDVRFLDYQSTIDDPFLYQDRYTLPSQVSSLVYSPGGALFYGLTNETAIGCFNPFRVSDNSKEVTIVLTDAIRLQFISSMKFIKNLYPPEEYILLLSNRLQKVLTGSINFEEINFRILKVSIRNLISGTICDEF